MKLIFIFSLVIIVIIVSQTDRLLVRSDALPDTSPFILGGTETTISEFPYMVSLQAPCGGSILNERTILTTAHCFVSR